MLNNQYPVDIYPSFQTFEFVSTGPQGAITKIVRYTETDIENVYNLGFGDKDELTGAIDDLIVTNNHDSQKVLATVVATLYIFIEHHPSTAVFATGSTASRTRLYQIGINRHFEVVTKDFVVLGLIKEEWEPFHKNVMHNAFLVHRKM